MSDIIDINISPVIETVDLTIQPNLTTINVNTVTGGGGAVDSVNGQIGVVVLDQDDILDGTTYKQYSLTEKNKLAGIEAGAEVNVNADWNAVSGDALILNKPTIPSITNLVPYTGATTDVDLGEFELKAGQVEFDQTPTGTAGVGVMRWNDTDGTLDLGLKGGNVTLQLGQEEVIRVVNKTATNINLLQANYQAVRVTGAQGQRLKVDLAQATNDNLSAETIGLVTETINNNQEGFITTNGLVRNINTTGSLQGETWVDGDIVYLSATTAGNITNVKPLAPNHLVIIGYVVSAHITQGSIFVKVDVGYELDELHNVSITTPLNNQALTYETSTQLWKNKTIIEDSLTNGITTIAPSQNAVFDALALKQNTLNFSTGLTDTLGTITNNLSTGVVGGQTINGGTASGNSLLIEPTTNATKGVVRVCVLSSGATSGGLSVGTANPNLNKIIGDSDHMVNIVNNGTALQSLGLWTYGSTGLTGENNVHFNRLRGTEASPTAVQSGDTGVSFGIRYRDNFGLGQSSSSFANVATENHTTNAHGSEWRFGATPNGSISRAHVLTIKSNALHISPNISLTPYRTTTNLVLDGASSGYSGDFRALLQSTATNGAGIILGNSTSQEAYIVRYGSSYSGNFTGTSIPYASTLLLQSGSSSNQQAVINGGSIINIIGTTSTNLGIRQTTNSFKIGTLSNVQTDGTATLHIAKAGTATAGTAPLKLTAGTNLTTPEDGAFEFDGTNLYFTVGGVRKTVTLI